MPHEFTCPLRWGDMDLLGHVNNVTYLDYAVAARESLFGDLPVARARASTLRLQFVRPLVFRRQPVQVATTVVECGAGGLTLHQEVYDAPADGQDRVVFFRARSRFEHPTSEAERAAAAPFVAEPPAWREPPDVVPAPWRHRYPVALRSTDLGPLDAEGRQPLRDTAYVELFQESRIHYLMDLHTRGEEWSPHVVGSTDIEIERPIDLSVEGLEVRSRIGHLGTRSYTILSDLHADDHRVATSRVVMVTFDLEAQRPGDMAPAQRTRLETELAGV